MHDCSKRISLFCVFVVATSFALDDVRAADGPTKKVLYIGIDGCRTDALLAAKAPTSTG